MHPINHTFQLDEPIKDRWIVSVFSFDQPPSDDPFFLHLLFKLFTILRTRST